MEHEPLLFIKTPSYAVQLAINESTLFDESTSIYEIQAPRVIENALIAHQLRFFARPTKKDRVLLVVLKNDERLVGTVERLQGVDVTMKIFEKKVIIDGNDIVAIYVSKK
ncbi:4-diphosphocytidyl-2C-methyl-D-erythritol kinase [Solibacillus sp. CAU 1738]|uniref:4-diphosphocytidyl-2C-methyl-D-erythritol kinase n=1 Tax=Solibacillus sp. CAU 1738 TaxID=3140363 RepID=UPI0032600DF9